MPKLIWSHPFVTWVVLQGLFLTGMFWLYYLGIIHHILATDWTHVTSIIFVWYILASLTAGYIALSFEKASDHFMLYATWLKDHELRLSFVFFSASQVMNVGLVGTTLGFIGMLSVMAGKQVDASTITTLIPLIWENWGTALYATASGMLGTVLLGIQGFTVSYALKTKARIDR